MPKLSSLSRKQQIFVKEYLKDLNATQAAIRAGYSEKTARFIACQNLTKLYISDEIQKEMKKREKRTEISADWVLKKLQEIADGCSQKIVVTDEEGKKKEVPQNPAGANRALELIGKHLGMFREIVEQRGPGFQLVIHNGYDEKEKEIEI